MANALSFLADPEYYKSAANVATGYGNKLADLLKEGKNRITSGRAILTGEPIAESLRNQYFSNDQNALASLAMDWANPVPVSGLVGMFAGKSAKTADLAKLMKAEELRAAGVPDEKIWGETGWTFGFPDKQPRFEIPDNAAKLKEAAIPDSRYAVGQALEHDPLYGYGDSAYPQLRNTPLEYQNGAGGQFVAEGNQGMRIGVDNPKSTTLHELQHAIQQREGFAGGGNPRMFEAAYEEAKYRLPIVERHVQRYKNAASDEAKRAIEENNQIVEQANNWAKQLGEWTDMMPLKQKVQEYILDQDSGFKSLYKEAADLKYGAAKLTPHEQYRRLAGEAEARLTQVRMNLTPEQRLAQYPVSQFDVPVENQIVRYGDDVARSVPKTINPFDGERRLYATRQGNGKWKPVYSDGTPIQQAPEFEDGGAAAYWLKRNSAKIQEEYQ